MNKFPKTKRLLALFCFTAVSVLFLCCKTRFEKSFTTQYGAIVRGDSTIKELSLVFTGDEFADGADHIRTILTKYNVKASFFLTGNFFRDSKFIVVIENLIKEGHYVGAHSDAHLLYCDWEKRDSLLVTREEFITDLDKNYKEMKRFGIKKVDALYFLPPYEWYNEQIVDWTTDYGLQLVNMTHGTLSHADYTTPEMNNYRDSNEIYQSIVDYDKTQLNGLNGFLLLMHMGTDPKRKDKFYYRMEDLILFLRSKHYKIVGLEEHLAKD